MDRRMARFWDRRARENPYYFVDNRLEYLSPEAERFWAGGEGLVDRVLESVGARIDPGDELVEVGCGVGRLTRVLARRAAHVRALDVSPRMLELARGHNPGLGNVTWLQGDGTSLAGVDDASADACFSHLVFQHVPDPRITLGYVRDTGRVLRPGGWAAYQVSNDPSIHRPRSRSTRMAASARALLGRGPGGQAHPAWLGSAVDLGELREAAAAGGLQVERVAGEGTQMCFVLLRSGG